MMILPTLRERVRSGYYTTYPGKARSTLEALLNEVEKLEADLAAAQAIIIDAGQQVADLKAENERLWNENAQLGMTVQLIAFSSNPDLAKFIAMARKTYDTVKALQPAKGQS